MVSKVLFSSNNDEWETPKYLFDHFNAIFNFKCDVAASDENHLCKKYFTIENSALDHDWFKTNWLNPPYSRGLLEKFLKKAYEEGLKGNLTVCLIASRTDTKYWHNYVNKADVIYFIKGRIKFLLNGVEQNSAPFPSCIVIFGLFNFEKETK